MTNRERVREWRDNQPLPWGKSLSTFSGLDSLAALLDAVEREAREDERKQCEWLAHDAARWPRGMTAEQVNTAVAAIRARAEKA